MADSTPAVRRWSVPGLEVEDLRMQVASLRYFKAEGAFAGAFAAATGTALPPTRTAVRASLPAAEVEPLVFSWMRPTETLALTAGVAALKELTARLANAEGGQLVLLSGGLHLLKLGGARVAELVGRLGSAGATRLNEVRRVRLADIPALLLSVQDGEVLLAVDRAYAAHLCEWLDVTLRDW